MERRSKQARHCTRRCSKAYNARLNYEPNRPSCLLQAPKVTSTTDLGDGRYRVAFEDGRAVSILATSPALARTRARWSLATPSKDSASKGVGPDG